MFPLMGAKWAKRRWTWPGGANIRLRAMQYDRDAAKYMGNSISWLCYDEAPNWSSPKPLNKLRAILRSPFGVPARLLFTGNPGGLLHNYFKTRFVDPAPPFTPIWDESTQGTRVFIPSLLTDTPQLAINDPGYRNRIIAAAVGDEALLQAWLYGSWNLPFGGLFDDLWRLEKHVIRPFVVPPSWYVDRSFDWGSSSPFSVCWWAESDGSTVTLADDSKITYPRGTLFLISEWYGWNENPDNVEGILMLARDVAKGIKAHEARLKLKVHPGPADPSINNEGQKGMSYAIDMAREGVRWTAANNDRIQGWGQCRKRLQAARDFPDGPNADTPGVFIFDHCRQFIRSVPNLPRDETKRDDLNTKTEDHIADAWRYRVATKRGKFGVTEVLI
jgi:hypothetical protein